MENLELVREMNRAIREGDMDAVRHIAEQDHDFLYRIGGGGSWLHTAASHGKVEIARYLIQEGVDVNVKGGTFCTGPLLDAVYGNKAAMVEFLLSQGAEMDTTDILRNPLFIFTTEKSYPMEIVKLLVEGGIDISIEYPLWFMQYCDACYYAGDRVCRQQEAHEYLKQKLVQDYCIYEWNTEKEQGSIQIFPNETPVTEEEIRELEERYAVTLPEQYVSFLKRYNGGEAYMVTFPVEHPNNPEIMDFYGLEVIDGSLQLCQRVENLRYFSPEGRGRTAKEKTVNRWLRQDLFPIGFASGATLLIGIRGKKTGQIWYHYNRPGEKVFRVLADDFNAFIGLCSSAKLDERCALPVEERERKMKEMGRDHLITEHIRKRWEREIEYSQVLQKVEVLP